VLSVLRLIYLISLWSVNSVSIMFVYKFTVPQRGKCVVLWTLLSSCLTDFDQVKHTECSLETVKKLADLA